MKACFRTYASVLILIFVLPCFMQVTYYIYFKLNQEAITELYCVNKDKPGMHCNGKCYLMKMLHPEKESQDNPILPQPEVKILTFIIPGIFKNQHIEFSDYIPSFSYFSFKLEGIIKSHWRPPR